MNFTVLFSLCISAFLSFFYSLLSFISSSLLLIASSSLLCMGILLFAEMQEILLAVLQSLDIGIENDSLLVSPCFSLLQSNFPGSCQALTAPVFTFKAEGSEFPLLGSVGVVGMAAFSVHLLANGYPGPAQAGSDYTSLRLPWASSQLHGGEMSPT